MARRARLALAAFLPALGCLALSPGGDRATAIPPDVVDRCRHWSQALALAGCRRFQEKAQRRIGALTTGDMLCLEPMLGDDQTNCRARAEVVDQDRSSTKLQFLEVDPTSSWTSRADQAPWFENAALVDLYLQAKGF